MLDAGDYIMLNQLRARLWSPLVPFRLACAIVIAVPLSIVVVMIVDTISLHF